ncbi:MULTISPECIES: DUF29 domain-containing protein [Pseudanabaena]|uniref:DUF29 domain-containing protein n=2 Tax=Pseudanabaena TaxID=1152 RepID=L8N4H5_9CYAN|nr:MULTISPECIES: DUF29 domain-containing protein [Pseudanabaena]ELS34019.1 protein of unknown function DUF29 [Pseudanabaena biceps PCC 7429]MDG3493747.1 DUF29 domain-containing protein [Pseudanabaena catenata USMAC16]
MTQTITRKFLYESDYLLWTQETIAKLKARDFDHIDFENLIEEIEDLGRSYRDELESRLDVLLSHILKRLYVPLPNDYNGWERTIREQRKQIRRRLEKSPSLKNYLPEIFDKIWQDVIKEVREDYPQYDFPDLWQFDRDIDTLLNGNFWS